MAPLEDLCAFTAVARHGGFRTAARATGTSASRLSEAIRRLEAQLGVRLLHRTTRSVTPTEAGGRLLARLRPVLEEVDQALEEVNDWKNTPAGRLRLNVPVSASRLVLPRIVPAFMAAYPDIELDVVADDRFVDVLAEGFDAGIRYGERLEKDMVAIPIGPRTQRFAAGASPAYLDKHGWPRHPRDLLRHACLRGRFSSGASPAWEFVRRGETVKLEVNGPLVVGLGGTVDLAVEAAVAGAGVVYLFEEWLAPYFERGELEPVLAPWWPRFDGPFLYFAGRRQLPAPLRAFVDFVKAFDRDLPPG
ncbi:LysR family transcriptional regulator [Schlegelella sp. S2-27]|uniref:LysR family transcriptional regulator n=1 Tax=Caldimonas mangrovi TaxID=2944811 RepID=A0ABT0YNY2_9BURK|nr:LysR family transcriptional regulator [Caldimonas mangrovi]MCM5680439.1 LysR family transcriptional regulator [Caldimonas mangrovi]